MDFNPFRGILSVTRESDRSNIHVECTVALYKIVLITADCIIYSHTSSGRIKNSLLKGPFAVSVMKCFNVWCRYQLLTTVSS